MKRVAQHHCLTHVAALLLLPALGFGRQPRAEKGPRSTARCRQYCRVAPMRGPRDYA